MDTGEVVVDGLACPEGPDLLTDGRIVFVETFLGRVSAWSPGRGLHPYAVVGGGPNAVAVGHDAVYVAQTGGHAGPWRAADRIAPSIQKVTEGGSPQELVLEVDGAPLLGPNDLAFGADGRLYFTDPGLFDPADPAAGRICVVEPDGRASVLVEVGRGYANGIAAEPDGSIVWSESFSRRIRRRRPDGAIEDLATLAEDRVPDGLKVADDGAIYVTGVTSGGLDVLAPDGRIVDFLPAGSAPLNCVFDGQDLYITDWGSPGPESEAGAAVTSGRLVRVRRQTGAGRLFRGAISSP